MWQAELREACEARDMGRLRALLAKGFVDVNAANKHGNSLLHNACEGGLVDVVELLLQSNAAVDATNARLQTPLHCAAYKGDLHVVELLLQWKADVDAADEEGKTPLHDASSRGHVHVVELLLQSNANIEAADKYGGRPLHYVSANGHVQVLKLLLQWKPNVDATDKRGEKPVHWCLRLWKYSDLDKQILPTLRTLVAAGAKWDTICEEAIPPKSRSAIMPALRLCVQLWMKEHDSGYPLTQVSAEVLKSGPESIQTYFDEVKSSQDLLYRLKLCFIGPSCAGKTTLIQSTIGGDPEPIHLEDRTIGIDHRPLEIMRMDEDSKRRVVYNVTVGDFGGKNAYHVSHTWFLVRHAIYVVCIDLEAFAAAFLQASIMAPTLEQEERLMDEFIERTMLQWVRMILARQPMAEFVFVATKEDLITENTRAEELLKDTLKAKLAEVDREIVDTKTKQAMRESFQGLDSRSRTDESPIESESTETDQLASSQSRQHPTPPERSLHVPPPPSELHFVSCTSFESVQNARKQIEALIIASERNFCVPHTYLRVLEAIEDIKSAPKNRGMTAQINQLFVPVDSLIARLPGDPERCRIILQTLHDLGEILWYKDSSEEMFRSTVILDPLLLIEFIRQVINHNNQDQTMLHENLVKLPYWMSLSDPKQLEAMKQLLQKFHLVYAANDDWDMRWDSDMIVPAYWQTKTSAAWLWLGDILRINNTQSSMAEAARVHWEFYFETGLPPSLFSHVIVASVSALFKFDAGPDWIVSEEKGITAVRILVGRDTKSLEHSSIHVEAVVSERATTQQADKLWAHFVHFCGSFVRVLKEYPGLVMPSFAWDNESKKTSLPQVMKWSQSDVTWLPPANRLQELSHAWNDFMPLTHEQGKENVPMKPTNGTRSAGGEDSTPGSLIDRDTVSAATRDLLDASLSGDLLKIEDLIRTPEIDINGRDEENGRTALHHAASQGYLAITLQLLAHDARVNATDQAGNTPLHLAVAAGHDETVKLLLEHSADVEATNDIQHTPLHLAARSGHSTIVKLLLEHAADVGTVTKTRSTALHLAILEGHVEIAMLLLKAKCDPNATNQNGETPLHLACRSCEEQAVVALLEAGAELHAVNKKGDEPLHVCIELNQIVDESTLRTLQVLVTCGSVWDAKCDEMIASGEACTEAAALRVCMSTWYDEWVDNIKYTQVPIEVIHRGPASTQSYIDAVKASARIVFRRKICVVGSSMAGKTSLIKSLKTKGPSLEHSKDRTIGIETSEVRFVSANGDLHVVTFWDFAGQDEYHVAHSLFFSRRTLFLVCVDLEAYVTAFMQADLMGHTHAARNQLTNEFIESQVLKWVRMIFLHQPDAEFAFIATKDDQFVEFPAFTKIAKAILNEKLSRVHGIALEMKREHEAALKRVDGERTADTLTIYAYEKKLEARNQTHNDAIVQAVGLYVSCTSSESVSAAWKHITEMIANSSRSFQMPDKFSAVLKAVTDLRAAAAEPGPSQRVSSVFKFVDALVDDLEASIDDIDRDTCRTILQILHDLGDVLWYEDLGVDFFNKTVILDPKLLIEFVRQVINHENAVDVLSHDELMAKPFWMELRDVEKLLAMKQVLEKFQLVHSSAGEIKWDSDLIIPAFWKSKTPASWLFCGEDAKLGVSADTQEELRVCWEYCFPFEFPDALFDHLMVVTYSPYFDHRKAGPDWIMYEKENVYNCRMIVTRDGATAQRVLCLEAVLAETADEDDRDELWEAFQLLAKGLFVVLHRYPGLLMTSRARHRTREKFERTRLDDLLTYPPTKRSQKWMPPADVLTWYKEIVKARAVQGRRGLLA